MQATKIKLTDLSTERLLLRKMEPRDAEDMFDYASRPEVTRFLLWREHPDLLYTRRYISYVIGWYRAGDFFDYAVVHRDSGHMIGTCGFARLDMKNRTGEIGYVINPRYCGRGYATEAARAVIAMGFSELELLRIEARYMENNLASARVMQKCGMTFEGILHSAMRIKDKQENIGIYAITQEDFGQS